jgi:hypothetical protein
MMNFFYLRLLVVILLLLGGTPHNVYAQFQDGAIITLQSALKDSRYVTVRYGVSKIDAYVSIHSVRKVKETAIRWKLERAEGEYFYLKDPLGKVMEVKNGSRNARTSVWLKHKSGSNAQKFKFRSAGGGFYYIVPKINPNLVLDVKNAYTHEGAGIWTHTLNRSKAQKFKVIKPLKDYVLKVDYLQCPREDDPGRGIEIFGKIKANITYTGNDNRIINKRDQKTLWSRSSSRPFEMDEYEIYGYRGMSTTISIPEDEFNNGKLSVVLSVDMWEHDGSSAHDRFVISPRASRGSHLQSAKGSNGVSNTLELEEGNTSLYVGWEIVPIR